MLNTHPHTWSQVLASVEIRAPAVPVLSNVTAAPFPSEPAAIRELLGRQLVEPVRYEAAGLDSGCFLGPIFPCWHLVNKVECCCVGVLLRGRCEFQPVYVFRCAARLPACRACQVRISQGFAVTAAC